MTEPSRLDRYDRRTDWPLAVVALTFLGLYSVRVLLQPQGGFAKAIDVALVAVYCIFVLDYLARLYLAQARGRWFLTHLWELPVILLPFFRPLRLLSLAVVVNVAAAGRRPHHPRAGDRLHRLWRSRSWCTRRPWPSSTSKATHPDAKIRTLGDALWWASTTVTTVGYGDLSSGNGDGPSRRSRVDDRWHHLLGLRDGDAGVVDRRSASPRRTPPMRRRRGRRSRSSARRSVDSRTWSPDDREPAYGEGREAI